MAILKEETVVHCAVCDSMIEENETVCDTSRSACHLACMSNSTSEICTACCAK